MARFGTVHWFSFLSPYRTSGWTIFIPFDFAEGLPGTECVSRKMWQLPAWNLQDTVIAKGDIETFDFIRRFRSIRVRGCHACREHHEVGLFTMS
jgi:hypothetical protein